MLTFHVFVGRCRSATCKHSVRVGLLNGALEVSFTMISTRKVGPHVDLFYMNVSKGDVSFLIVDHCLNQIFNCELKEIKKEVMRLGSQQQASFSPHIEEFK